jgi:PDZ domain-containing secreted protein/Zn-dependent protease/CBS domain-containing protein
MRSSFTILRVRGIPIGAHWSWLLIVALIVWSLWRALFPATYPGLSSGVYLAMALVAALLFFGSVLAHELGHALQALKEGQHIEGITLWLFGGVAHLGELPRTPGTELRVSLAGPLVSVVLTLLFTGASLLSDAANWPAPVHGTLDYLARINLLVLVFNLVPALPLDGGRVLRAWLWHRQRSFTAATRSAALAGRVFGFALVAIGILGLFTGTGVGGLWLVLIGWFLLQAARSEVVLSQVRQALDGRSVRDVMTRDPLTVPADLTVAGLLDRAGHAWRVSTYPVIEHDRPVGLVSLRTAAGVPAAEQSTRLVSEVMTPSDKLNLLRPEQPAIDTLDVLRRQPGRALVVEDGRVVGIVASSDVMRVMEVDRLRGIEPRAARGSGVLVWVVVGVLIALAAGWLYQPPVLVLAPGPTADVARDITITGTSTTPVNGRYLLTSVRLQQPNGIAAVAALVNPDQDLVSRSEVIPSGSNPGQYIQSQRAVFEQSRRLAAAAAARAAGLPVTITGSGARVVQVLPASPAARELRPGDVIVAVDGRPISTADALRQVLQSRPPGSELTLTVERNGSRETLRVRTARLTELSGGVGLGVAIETRNLTIDLPFEIRFAERGDVAGPSAGLSYALAIADLLEREDYARGRTIAATGTIDPEGDVGEVGGVDEKADGAKAAGAAIFLVPEGELEAARDAGVPVVGVDDLEEALAHLRTRA